MKARQLLVALTLFCQTCLAKADQSLGGWQCWADASARFKIPADLLYAIARVESGNRSDVVSKPNSNGTYDIGLMQINSSHLPRLAKMGITEQDLLTNACLNLHVGAMILSEKIATYGYNWVAIGAYNARSYNKRMAYARKVFDMYNRILSERNKSLSSNPFSKVNKVKRKDRLHAVIEYQRRLAELHKQIQDVRQRISMLEAELSQGIN